MKPDMEAVRQKLNKIRQDIEEVEDKTKNIEMYVRLEQQRLDSCTLERESLQRKVDNLMRKIDLTQDQYQEKLEKLQEVETTIDINESKRKALEKRENGSDDQLTVLEDRLRVAKINHEERKQLLDEAKRREQVLRAELQKCEKRCQDAKEKADFFDSEIDHAGQQLRQMERKEMLSTGREIELEEEMRILGDQLREAQGKWFLSDEKLKALSRTKEGITGRKLFHCILFLISVRTVLVGD